MIKEYGVALPFASQEIRNRAAITNLERYGSEFAQQHKSVQKSISEGILKSYSEDNLREKVYQGHLKIYGCWSSAHPDIHQKMINTNLKRYGVKYGWHTSKAKSNWFRALLFNSKSYSSKAEDKFYEYLLTKFLKSDIIRWYWIQRSEFTWCIDFYIKSINAFVQFDGIWYHGLDKPIEEIRSSTTKWDINRTAAYDKDRRQDAWFKSQNKRLVRITDSEFNEQGMKVLEKI